MKVGDLIRFGSTTPDNRTTIQRIVGLVVDMSGIMVCSHAVVIPYKMGRVEVLWPDARGFEMETYSSLEVISECR